MLTKAGQIVFQNKAKNFYRTRTTNLYYYKFRVILFKNYDNMSNAII